jgi:hypothetical protein
MALGLARAIAEILKDGGFGNLYDEANPVIFLNEEPDSPGTAITVLEEAGGAPFRTITEERSFTIQVRQANSENASETAHDIHRYLQEFQGVKRGIRFGIIEANFNPVPIGRDRTGKTGGLWRWTQTFRAVTRRYSYS